MSDVNVLNPSGQLVSLPADQVADALKAGYSQATHADVQNFQNQEQYGGTLNEAATALEAAAGTATFGISRHLENSLNITTPEAQRMRHETNPEAATIGDVVGIGGSLLSGNESVPIKALSKITHGISEAALPAVSKFASKIINPETSPMISKILSKAGAGALGSAVEGAAFGLGQSVNEDALGDSNALGEKLISNVGWGSALGGGFGALLGPLSVKGAKASTVQSALQDDIASSAESSRPLAAVGDIATEGAQPAQGLAVDASAESPFKDLPRSLEDIRQSVDAAGSELPKDLPSGQLLRDAVDTLPDLQYKPHNLQYESLTDKGLRDYYKTFLEAQGDDAKALRDYEALQKQEGVSKLGKTLDMLAPEKITNADPVSAGNKLADSFVEQYEAEKKELAPAFKQFDEAAKGTSADAGNVILKLQDSGMGIDAENLIKISDDGKFSVDKYSPEMSISKNTHGAISDLVKVLNKEPSISQLRNVREAMRDRLTLAKGPRDEAQIGSIRKVLMDEMEERVAKGTADQSVRDTFKRYAVNEQKRGILEKILGGSVSDKAAFNKAIKPEDVLDKIFSNSNSVAAAKDLLGSKFDQVTADYLAGKVAGMTDNAKNGFSSQKFSSFLRTKGPELAEAFAEKPGELKRIRALTDYMRILPDAPSVNPSGTAKTLNILQRISTIGKVLNPKQTIIDFGEKLAEKSEAARQKSTIQEILKGQSLKAAQMSADESIGHYSALAKLERAAQNTTNIITNAAKSIFSGAVSAAQSGAGFLGSRLAPNHAGEKKKTQDVIAQLNELNNNPEQFINHLESASKAIYPFAPKAAQGIQQTMTTAVQYLQSKAPQAVDPRPLAPKLEPSKFELAQFERHYNAVENPTSVLHQIKNCSLTPEALESVKTVYPKLYDQMSAIVMHELTDHVAKNGVESIPYKTKLGLSMFLNQDLDHTLGQMAIASNQMTFINHAVAPQQGKNQPKSTQGGLAKIDSSNRLLTPGQASNQRPVT